MWALQSQAAELPGQTQGIASLSAAVSNGATNLLTELGTLSAQCIGSGASVSFCQGLGTAVQNSYVLANGYAPMNYPGATGLAAANSGLAAGMIPLSEGITKLANGSTDIATGVEGIASGTTAIAGGSTELANGLDKAVENIPVYTEAETKKLSEVVTAPVALKDAGNLSFGANSTPLYVVLSLWIGALAIFVGLRTLPQRLLESTRSSLSLATRSFVIPAVVGIAQGVAVATVIAVANGYDLGEWGSVAAIAALIGIAFTATNQALNAVLGGFGRMVSLAVGILILVTGVISTVPALLDTLLGFTPANDAVTALQAVINSGNVSGFASAVTALVLWSLGGVLVTALAISRKRHVSITTLSKETQPV
jgi:putative membrane protein